MAYMLVGYDSRETWARVMYRLEKMKARGIRPFPMIYGDRQRGLPMGGYNGRIEHRRLAEFQRWVNGKFYNFVPFEAYDAGARGKLDEPAPDLFDAA